MIIGPGITINPGVNLQATHSKTSMMYSLLSPAGQTAYNSTASGNFFAVTATDYTAVINGLAGVSIVGMNATQLAESGSAFSGNFAVSLPQAVSSVTSNSYIIGFAMGLYNTVATIQYLTSSTFGTGIYQQLANTVTSTLLNPAISYFLRKTPTPVSTTTYVSMMSSQNYHEGTTLWTNAKYSAGNATPGAWTNYSGATMPLFQTLVTTIQPY
jgi:hypothetical protein